MPAAGIAADERELVLAAGVLFAALDTLVVAWAFRRRTFSLWISLHLVLFVAFVVLFNLAALVVADLRYEPPLFLAVNALVFVYLAVLAGLGRVLRTHLPSNGAQLAALDRVPEWQLWMWLLLWLAFKAYLYPRYGLHSFQLLRVRDSVGIPYWEAALNALLGFPALGAFLAFLLRAARSPHVLLKVHLAAPALAFFVLFGLTNEVEGTRRFFAALLVWTAIGTCHAARFRLRPRHVALSAGLLAAAVGFSEYFQRIRGNMVPMTSSSGTGESLPGFVRYLAPRPEAAVLTLENLHERDNPFRLLYQVTGLQATYRAGTGGALTLQALANVAPALAVEGKSYVSHDDILVATYGLDGNDVTAVPLLSLQSDFSYLAYLLTPLLYVGLVWVYAAALVRGAGGGSLVALGAAGAAFLTVFRVEDGVETLLITLRNFGAVWLAGALAVWMRRPLAAVRRRSAE
jgi:hypothetical protein